MKESQGIAPLLRRIEELEAENERLKATECLRVKLPLRVNQDVFDVRGSKETGVRNPRPTKEV